jgi:hypothetical protein
MFTLADPNAITFPRFNANNSVTALSASAFRTAIGAGTSSSAGVTSIATSTGLSGGTITSTGTLTNTDRGSSQAIYKNFTASSGGTATANSNNDTLTIAAGSNVTTVRSGDTITINATNDGQGVTSIATTNGITGGTITGTGTLQVDSTVVRTTGTQTIGGSKTFSSTINGNASGAFLLRNDGSALTTQRGSGTVAYPYAITSTTTGLFAASDNANSIFTVNRHPGNYYSQLGFSSNGNLYYRNFVNTAINTTQGWNQLAFTSSIPTVNNGVLTMTTGTGLDGGTTFAANQSGNTSFNVTLDLTEISLGAGLDSTATGLTLDLSEFTDMTAGMNTNDEFIVLDSSAERRKRAGEIGLSIFSNDAGFITSSSIPSVGNGTLTVQGTTGLSGSGTFTANQSGNTTITLTNSAPNVVQTTVSGNAGSATVLQTARTIAGVSFDGSANISLNNNAITNGAGYITSASLPSVGNGQIDGRTSGNGLSGSMDATANQSGNTTFTVTSNATTAATASTIAYRDGSADLSARLFRANYANQGTISGAIAFRVNNSSDNYTRYCSSPSAIRAFIGAGTSSTTGTISSINATTNGNSLGTSNTLTGNGTLTLAWQGNTASYVRGDGSLATFPSIPQGDITNVTAGTGMTGGGSSGSVTLNVIGGDGITANADNIVVDGTVVRTSGTQSIAGAKTFTTTPISVTRSTADSSTYLATTAFVKNQGYVASSGVTSVATGGGLDGGTITTTGTIEVEYDGVSTNIMQAGTNYLSSSIVVGDYLMVTDPGNTGTYRRVGYTKVGNLPFASSSVVSGVTSVATGSGLTGGTITSTGTLSHADTSSQATVNNSGNTYIQDVTLDTFGHVTGLVSATTTLGGLGFTGATNANYITNNNQLTNGAGYKTSSGVTSVATTSPILGGTITSTGTLSLKVPVSGAWHNGGVAIVGAVTEVGRYIDFHTSNTGTSDFDIRLDANGSELNCSGNIRSQGNLEAVGNMEAGYLRTTYGVSYQPSHSFTSDTNTGMYRSGTDQLGFSTGGSQRVNISNSTFYVAGNLGAGTNSPLAKLHVNGISLVRGSTGVGDFYLGNVGTANHFRFHTNNSNTYFDMNCGNVYWRDGGSTRYTFFPSTANMTINGTLTQNSDSRVKENVVEIGDCISKVQAMRGVYYNRTDFNTEVTKVGVIAQEVEAVLPELILESPDDGLKSVAYSELTAVLINAIKEQQEIIEDLKTRIIKLEK